MNGELTPEDRDYLRAHRKVVADYVSSVLDAAGHVGPIRFESISMSARVDRHDLATAARLAKRIIDAAQPKAYA